MRPSILARRTSVGFNQAIERRIPVNEAAVVLPSKTAQQAAKSSIATPDDVYDNGMILCIFNDSPYGSQRTFNGLRVAAELSRKNSRIAIFLLGDGVTAGLKRQSPSDVAYNAQEMLRLLGANGVPIAACTTCLQARGIADEDLVAGVHRGSLEGLTNLIEDAEKVLSF